MPGISAVSPPTSAQPACSQPSAIPLDHGRGHVDVEPSGRVVVEEEQGFGTLHHDVVHAHRNQVDADAVVPAQFLGNPELRSDAVGPRDQHRAAVTLDRQFEHRAEAAEPGQDARAPGARREGLDTIHQGVARIDVDAGVAVGQTGAGFRHGGSLYCGK